MDRRHHIEKQASSCAGSLGAAATLLDGWVCLRQRTKMKEYYSLSHNFIDAKNKRIPGKNGDLLSPADPPNFGRPR